MKIKFFKNKKTFRKKNSQINPNIYWKYVLYTLGLMILSAFAFGYYLFSQINKGDEVSIVNSDTSTKTVKEERINKVLDHFREREQKSVEILNSPSDVVDPSL